ncbi:MAG: ribbon-helix-helix protein, CopG family [Actinomycetia bacterium]|nr:ribbon-helix-helix protein, CopG family [Actinomycetes bacterium]
MTRYTDAGDIDLDEEVVRRRDGTRITEADADQQGQRIADRRGRPSLSGDRQHSPQIGVRLTNELDQRLTARAQREHKSRSQVVREALERHVAS